MPCGLPRGASLVKNVIPAEAGIQYHSSVIPAKAGIQACPTEVGNPPFVIPAEAGIQTYLNENLSYYWIPASAGMTEEESGFLLPATRFRGHKPGFPLPRE